MKWLMIPLGGLTILAGLVLFWMPLPIGLPLVGLGTWLLLRFSRRGRRLFVKLSRRYPWLRRARVQSTAALFRFQQWLARYRLVPPLRTRLQKEAVDSEPQPQGKGQQQGEKYRR